MLKVMPKSPSKVLFDAYDCDIALGITHDLNLNPIQSCETLRRQDLLRLPGCHLPVGDVNHFVEVRQERVDVVCNEQRCDATRMNHLVDKVQQVALAPHIKI